MTPEQEQRWDRIDQTLEYVATLQRSHDEQIGKLVEQGDRNERLIGALTEQMGVLTEQMGVLTKQMGVLTERMGVLTERTGVLTERMGVLTERMGVLTERTIQAMDAVNRLANIAVSHEDRIDRLEDGSR